MRSLDSWAGEGRQSQGGTHCGEEYEAGKESRPPVPGRSLGLEYGDRCWDLGGQGAPGLQSSDALAAVGWTQADLGQFGGGKLEDLGLTGEPRTYLWAPPVLLPLEEQSQASGGLISPKAVFPHDL